MAGLPDGAAVLPDGLPFFSTICTSSAREVMPAVAALAPPLELPDCAPPPEQKPHPAVARTQRALDNLQALTPAALAEESCGGAAPVGGASGAAPVADQPAVAAGRLAVVTPDVIARAEARGSEVTTPANSDDDASWDGLPAEESSEDAPPDSEAEAEDERASAVGEPQAALAASIDIGAHAMAPAPTARACEPAAAQGAGQEDAIFALLALQRAPSTQQPPSTQLPPPQPDYAPAWSIGACPEPSARRPWCLDARVEPPAFAAATLPPPPITGVKRRSPPPYDAGEAAVRFAPMPKPDGTGDSKFFCKFPNCGKGYASTDAVRKHCRQRHLEWLRRLGHGCPALYCSWEGGPAV